MNKLQHKEYLRVYILSKLNLNSIAIEYILNLPDTICAFVCLKIAGCPYIGHYLINSDDDTDNTDNVNEINEIDDNIELKKCSDETIKEMKRAIRLPNEYHETYVRCAVAGKLNYFWNYIFHGKLLPEKESSIIKLAEEGRLKYSIV